MGAFCWRQIESYTWCTVNLQFYAVCICIVLILAGVWRRCFGDWPDIFVCFSMFGIWCPLSVIVIQLHFTSFFKSYRYRGLANAKYNCSKSHPHQRQFLIYNSSRWTKVRFFNTWCSVLRRTFVDFSDLFLSFFSPSCGGAGNLGISVDCLLRRRWRREAVFWWTCGKRPQDASH